MSDKKLQDYAVELANEALRSYEFIDVVEQLEHLTDEECEQVHDLITGEVKAHISEPPRIIRTLEELEALDPDAVTVDNEETIENANMWLDDSGKPYPHDERFLPAAVLATGAQFRAALEAMEQINE